MTVKREIFSLETVEKTAAAYGKIAAISVRHEPDQSIISFSNCRFDEDRTVKEFENYMIGIENS